MLCTYRAVASLEPKRIENGVLGLCAELPSATLRCQYMELTLAVQGARLSSASITLVQLEPALAIHYFLLYY
jgi:hypothetical protein